MKKIRKICAVVTAVTLCFSYLITPIYASDERINPKDISEILNEATIAGKAWESIGFKAEDIAELTRMKRNEKLMSTFNSEEYEAFLDNQVNMSEEEMTEYLFSEDGSAYEPYVYDHKGNPPESTEEQIERIEYVTNVALKKYGNLYNTEKFNKYVFYLYMSHYIDNPNYKRSNPGFSHIYADVITESDILAYEKFVAESKFVMFADNLVNLVNSVKSNVSNIKTIKNDISNIKKKSKKIAWAVYGILKSKPIKYPERAKLLITSLKKHYESKESVTELIEAIHQDFERDGINDIGKNYIELCANGLLSLIAETFTPFGFSLSVGLFAFNQFLNLYDEAKLVALHYSLSARKADRLDKLLFG